LLTLPGAQATLRPAKVVLSGDGGDDYRAKVAGELNAWWLDDPDERYWLEVTDRPDVGVDLHAPQRDARGNPSPGYSLMWWVNAGDVVFHYQRDRQEITGWSRAVGRVVEAPVVWLSHRGATRRRISSARPQAGWWLDLDGPFELEASLTLEELRARGSVVRAVLDELRARKSGALYFPFSFYGGTELRPMQPYLNKLPAALVSALPELAVAAGLAGTTEAMVGSEVDVTRDLGTEYRAAGFTNLPDVRDPFSVDPAVVERGLRGHAETQNALAAALSAAGYVPRSPRADEPNFDLAWQHDGVVYVAEVKSTTPRNEERQLRLGLGQVLRYQSLLRRQGFEVRSVLVAEHAPRDLSWQVLCEELGVILVTPENLAPLLP
jgi:hypothetical protein